MLILWRKVSFSSGEWHNIIGRLGLSVYINLYICFGCFLNEERNLVRISIRFLTMGLKLHLEANEKVFLHAQVM